VAGHRRTEAGAIALALLDEGDRTLLRDAVMVLGLAGATEAAGRIAALGEDTDPMIRAAVATALARLEAPEAPAVLARLIRDPDDYVRMMAGRGYGRLPDADPAVIQSLLDDPRARVAEQTAEGLAEAGTPAALELLERYLRTHNASGDLFRALEGNPRSEVTELMRALLFARDWYVRQMAIVHLGRAGDTTSLPRIRMLLDAETMHERQAAAEALGRLGDTDAVDDLVGLLRRDTNPHGRIAAAKALVALRAVDELPALDEAAAAETGWAAEELHRQAETLRALAASP
jgi:HEAT repeat protein